MVTGNRGRFVKRYREGDTVDLKLAMMLFYTEKTVYEELEAAKSSETFRGIRWPFLNVLHVDETALELTLPCVPQTLWHFMESAIEPDEKQYFIINHVFPALLVALRILHELDIVYLDMHPGNVLIDESGSVYLVDFSSSYWEEEQFTGEGTFPIFITFFGS